MNEHRHVQDLLGPYLLGSLEDEEMLEVREHLSRCAECQTVEQSLRRPHEDLVNLANLVQQPPPNLKDQILNEPPSRSPRRAARREARRLTRRLPLVAAAAVLFVLATLAILYTSGLINQETVDSTTLEPTELAPQAGGELLVQENDDPNVQATLEVWDLPQPDPGEYYELWFGKGEGRVSAGTFTVDAEGRGTFDMTVPDTADDYQRVGITLERFPEEPDMGSARVVLGGELSES